MSTRHHRVVIESGRQKVFATALDWPGWSRSGRTEQAALAALTDYTPRYVAVAERAGLRGVKAAAGEFAVVEHLQGSGATDFGIPDRIAVVERDGLTTAELNRHLKLLAACWETFDDIAARVSPSLRKGPRGGGRDRDDIVDHVRDAEAGYVRYVTSVRPERPDDTPDAIAAYRKDVLAAIRATHKAGELTSTWPYPYLIRRMAWHLLDHAWEMEDRDLT